MEAILRSVPEEMVLTLGAKETAKEAWDTIKTLHIGVERVRESKAQTLRLQYEEIRFKAGEQVNGFAYLLQGLITELATLGDPYRCQNRRISGRGSRTMRLGSMVIGDGGHDVYPGSGPLYGGNTLLPSRLILMNMSITTVDLPRDRNG